MMSTTSTPEKRWPPEYRETAYELYAGMADQSVTKVADLLSGLKREIVPISTVSRWKTADKWEERLSTESPVASPYLRNVHLRGLVVAAPEAVSYLLRVVTGQEEPDAHRIRSAIAVEQAARTLILKAADLNKPDNRRTPIPHRPDLPTRDLSTMTGDELEAEERQRRAERERRIKEQEAHELA